MSGERSAFVILPFEEKFSEIYTSVIKPVCEDLGYEVNKADSIASHRNILEDIIKGISEADILIADLTTSNPNVFYEAGIAHGLGVPTVLITQDIEEVPFDLKAYEIIEYSTEFDKIEELENELSKIAERHLKGEIQFGSPVSDFTDISVKEPSSKTEDLDESNTNTNEKTGKDEEPDKEILDYAAEAKDRRSNLEEEFKEIEDSTSELEIKVMQIDGEINETMKNKGNINPKKLNRAAREIAEEIDYYTDTVDKNTDSIEKNLDFMMDAVQKFIETSNPNNKEQRDLLREQKQELADIAHQTDQVISDLEEFQLKAEDLRGISRTLTSSVNDLVSVLDSLIDIFTEVNAKAERLVSLIDQKITNSTG